MRLPKLGAPTPAVPPATLRQGDTVLIAVAGTVDYADTADQARTLEQLFPGVRFVFVDNVTGICVKPAEAVDG